MGYWDPPEYFDEAKFPEIDAETDTLIEHLVGAIKEEYKDKIAKESDAYQDLKASYDSLRRELTNKNSDLLAKDGLIETLNKELAKKKTEHPSFKFDIGEKVFTFAQNTTLKRKLVVLVVMVRDILNLMQKKTIFRKMLLTP